MGMPRRCPPLLPILLLTAAATAVQPPNPDESNNAQNNLRPSSAIVIGIFSIMFFLIFLLLMYAKFCHNNAANFFSSTGSILVIGNGGNRSENGRTSGIDKAVIESLPFFKFSALKGSREGLECAVCLSRFNDNEQLRLLPRCKHAFHMDCIDRWLESHSSCPLCRARVDVDVAFFKFSTSSRHLHTDPSGRPVPELVEGDNSGLELYVEREHDARNRSKSTLLAASFRWAVSGEPPPLHNYKHRIVVSDVVFRSRWSDFNSADLIRLDSEMLRVMSSRRFEKGIGSAAGTTGVSGTMSPERGARIKEEMGMKRRLESKAVQMQNLADNRSEEYSNEFLSGDMRSLISPGSRCLSDITEVSRYRPSKGHGGKDESVRQMWLPIARQTVQFFAGKERRSMMLLQHSARGSAEYV